MPKRPQPSDFTLSSFTTKGVVGWNSGGTELRKARIIEEQGRIDGTLEGTHSEPLSPELQHRTPARSDTSHTSERVHTPSIENEPETIYIHEEEPAVEEIISQTAMLHIPDPIRMATQTQIEEPTPLVIDERTGHVVNMNPEDIQAARRAMGPDEPDQPGGFDFDYNEPPPRPFEQIGRAYRQQNQGGPPPPGGPPMGGGGPPPMVSDPVTRGFYHMIVSRDPHSSCNDLPASIWDSTASDHITHELADFARLVISEVAVVLCRYECAYGLFFFDILLITCLPGSERNTWEEEDHRPWEEEDHCPWEEEEYHKEEATSQTNS
ncbi:hypothetical protein EI94DRAFT_1801579 [Lactarius quietus]|nr:hypothetical protein EI94DRAFT_1801579 [Lactarius quietus]